MRIFGRFLYALLAVGFFLLAFTYSQDLMRNKYLEDVFGLSLTDESSPFPKYYYFYTSIPDYHKSDPVIEIDVDGYEIRGYEVLKTEINNDNELETTEFIYIIVYSDYQDLSKISHLSLIDSITEDTQDINLTRFKTLNILNGVNPEGTVYLAKDLFLSSDFDTINLINHDLDLVFESAFSIEDSNFTIKQNIVEYYQENNELPGVDEIDQLSDGNIFPNKPHIATDYAYIFWIGMGVYFTILIFMTYIIFFRKRKYS
jgi:hypothetical protein